MKNILVIYYSQSGQLSDILNSYTKPFMDSPDFCVDFIRLEPEKEFKFPWSGYPFFDSFPESVNKTPCELKSIKINEKKSYDLVILGYQCWYLSPSIPFNSFLLSDQGKTLLKDKPVITVIGSRNMWLQSQEYVKDKISQNGGNLVGNISLRDKSENLTGIITISYWMFTGKKGRFLGVFPKPGVSEQDIAGSVKFGDITKDFIERDDYKGLQQKLVESGAVKINSYLISLEARGTKIFNIWARFIARKGGPGDMKRAGRVRLFAFYLPVAILILAPIIFILSLPIQIITYKSTRKKKEYYKGIALQNT